MRFGSHINPPNRFEKRRSQHVDDDPDFDGDHHKIADLPQLEIIEDASKSVVTRNNSPDLSFNLSLNPYRGCAHGCSYCYARPTHEYLGFNAGLDFETKIVVKKQAPRLFQQFLANPAYLPEGISFSGVTDCYQPVERQFRLTRQCLEIALQCRQPVGIVTKNALVLRDLDIISEMARLDLIHVYVSVTTLKPELARAMEPRTSIPRARLRAIKRLVQNGVPTGVMIAPVIPGLNESEIPDILKSASECGAQCAGYVMLRLPLTVAPVFKEWLGRVYPDGYDKVMNRIQRVRGGMENQSEFGTRMRGTGVMAEQIRSLFRIYRSKHGMENSLTPYNCDLFQRPEKPSRQKRLF